MKKLMIFSLVLLAVTATAFYFARISPARAESDQQVFQRLLSEIEKEKAFLESRRNELDLREQNLQAYQRELEMKRNEHRSRETELADREAELQKRIEERVLDRQMIETFESIDSEQAAVLMASLFKQDSHLAILVMRRLAGKKSGKILEAMIAFDPEGSTALARETLDFYRKLD